MKAIAVTIAVLILSTACGVGLGALAALFTPGDLFDVFEEETNDPDPT